MSNTHSIALSFILMILVHVLCLWQIDEQSHEKDYVTASGMTSADFEQKMDKLQ